MFDAGLFALELPLHWNAELSAPGSLRLADPGGRVEVSIAAVARGDMPATPELPSVEPVEAQFELHRWVDTQKNIQVRDFPRLVPGASNPTACTEGLEQPAGHPWYKRLLLREPRARWRFWAIVNPHVVVLASCRGPSADERICRAAVDRMIASIQITEREILLGRPFAEMVVSLARTYFPRTVVAAIDDAHVRFGSRKLSLSDLHQRYLASPEDLPAQVQSFLSAIQSDLPASTLATTWADASDRFSRYS